MSRNLDRDELTLAADEAPDLLKFILFFLAERMIVFAISIELSWSATEGRQRDRRETELAARKDVGR